MTRLDGVGTSEVVGGVGEGDRRWGYILLRHLIFVFYMYTSSKYDRLLLWYLS